MKYLIVITTLIVVGGCTHRNVAISKNTDDKLSCLDLVEERAEINNLLSDIDDKTGFSGRNVAMGIFFWPGILVNQMNAGDAREAAQKRLVLLSEIEKKLNCE